MKPVFETVELLLKAKVVGLKLVEEWNNQLENDGVEKLLPFPSVFYQLDSIRTQTISTGIQHAEGILRVRHCDWQLRSGKLRGAALEAATYLELQGFRGGPLLTGLDRQAIYPDANHGAVQVIISEYRIKYEDRTQYNKRRQTVSRSISTSVE